MEILAILLFLVLVLSQVLKGSSAEDEAEEQDRAEQNEKLNNLRRD